MSYEEYIINQMINGELYEITFEHFEDCPHRAYVIAYGSNEVGEWVDELIYYDDKPEDFKPSIEWLEFKLNWHFKK